MWFWNAIRNIFIPIGQGIIGVLVIMWLVALDILFTLLNLILPRKRQIPAVWNEYIPPMSTDSRSPCPALNALCSELKNEIRIDLAGVLPRDGKNVTFREITVALNSHYNLSINAGKIASLLFAQLLQKSFDDKIEMSSLGAHNCAEHDGSLTRRDIYFQPNQGTPDKELIQEFFLNIKDGKRLTRADCSRAISTRLTNSARTNPQFSLRSGHLFISAVTAVHLVNTFGGTITDLEPFLLDERIPEGWMPINRCRLGLTALQHYLTAIPIFLGINPSWKLVKLQS